jgi:hypothetical protein
VSDKIIEFHEWPKTPRWNRTVVVTEKIDGTNSAVIIVKQPFGVSADQDTSKGRVIFRNQDESGFPNDEYVVYAQSRKRIITPDNDNYGFAKFVWDNAEALVDALGEGRHYGEWWGQGIQRRYGMDHKRFSLFNSGRWDREMFQHYGLDNVDVVPVLYHGTLDHQKLHEVELHLRERGSLAAELAGGEVGFPAEGYMIWHSASRQIYKVLLEGDDISKTEAGIS